jgi:hypothetical protein
MAVIQVIRPELTPEERAKRMEAIKKATVELIVAYEKAKAKKQGALI